MKPVTILTHLVCVFALHSIAAAGSLPGTEAFEGDASPETLADRVLDDWRAFYLRETEAMRERREERWRNGLATDRAGWVEEKRERLARLAGLVEEDRLPLDTVSLVETLDEPALIEANEAFEVKRVRWTVFEGVEGEGLFLEPATTPRAQAVLLPDADQTPEEAAGLVSGTERETAARKLAAAGCRVVIPVLLNRDDTWSGSAELDRWTNQPHREWIYRQAFQAGRHIIGYEIQKTLALVDWFEAEGHGPTGVLGYGEGGLLALYAAALDGRIDAALVSGYFGPREGLWEEPIYRNVWQLLEDFGDAEIASLVAPRVLIVEHSEAPDVTGPPEPRDGRRGAAPGRIETPSLDEVRAEFDRARDLADSSQTVRLLHGDEDGTVDPWSDAALRAFREALELEADVSAVPTGDTAVTPDAGERQRRQVRQLERYTQRLIRESESERGRRFWEPLEAMAGEHSAAEAQELWRGWTEPYRDELWDDVIGRLPSPEPPFSARTKVIREEPAWTAHLVVLEPLEEVTAWGYLLAPTDIDEGEQRAAVVCQHGLGSTPASWMDPDSGAYAAQGARLAEEGFVVFAPYNPNAVLDGTRFRQLQRKANPAGLSIFSGIIAQHEVFLEWFGGLPFVDEDRIGFYGLSYGGKTAMRAGALIDGYAAVICSGDFNEWVRKVTTVDAWHSPPAPAPSNRFSGYPFTVEYEIFEFNLAHTFNYAEMAALIAPRPFMVERGHHDRVASDEWVAFEYAKVRRLYNTLLDLPGRTVIEYFDGGHRLHGEGTFEFLKKHLELDVSE
ncbi:MAG: alpha/beta hydrolase family protein [Candidatus Hydrogenedentota bacterium]